MDTIVLLNPEANGAKSVISYFKDKEISYLPISKKEYPGVVAKKIKEKYRNFIICGGDGTINGFVNILMKFPEAVRNSVKLSIIPSGKANDLANFMNLPLDIHSALEVAKKGSIKKIDVIKVNSRYMVTGGGFGLPSEVVLKMERKSWFYKLLSKVFKGDIYKVILFRLLLFGYSGLKTKNTRHLAICVLNQGIIGKQFNINPNSRNSDGLFEIAFIKKPKGIIPSFLTVKKISSGKFFSKDNKIQSFKKTKILFDKKEYFMGDGEILDYNKEFSFQVLPKALSISC